MIFGYLSLVSYFFAIYQLTVYPIGDRQEFLPAMRQFKTLLSERIVDPIGGYCVHYPSNIFRNILASDGAS